MITVGDNTWVSGNGRGNTKRQPCGLICICPQRIYVTGKTFVEQYNSYCNFYPNNLSKQNKKENN